MCLVVRLQTNHGGVLGQVSQFQWYTNENSTWQWDGIKSATVSQNPKQYRFTGKEPDDNGLLYFGARYYDPEIGRFITEDPARDGLNWYVYCYNNPLKYIDPTGMFGADIHRGDDNWGTLRWAQDVGFSSEHALLIAKANYGVDTNIFATDPVVPWGQKYHFNTYPNGTDSRIVVAERHLDKAISLYNQAMNIKGKGRGPVKWFLNEYASSLEEQAMEHLGQGLHAIQDMYAHTDEFVDSFDILLVINDVRVTLTIYHHLGPKGEPADKWDKEDPNASVLAAQNATYDYLNRFIEEVDCFWQ